MSRDPFVRGSQLPYEGFSHIVSERGERARERKSERAREKESERERERDLFIEVDKLGAYQVEAIDEFLPVSPRLHRGKGLLIRKHDQFMPTRQIKRHVRAPANNHPGGWKL